MPNRFRAPLHCDILRLRMLKYHVIGRWKRGEIATRWVPSSFQTSPRLDAQIEAAWRQAKARLGEHLFDGPMCRLENWRVDVGILRLELSLTSYRIFVGTNMTQPALRREELALSVGVSTLLITADGFIMMGRRSGNVAYYPHRLHPFAGSLEPGSFEEGEPPARLNRAPDLFDNALRELHEELGLARDDIHDIVCLGIVEDTQLSHPETIFAARTSATREKLEGNLPGSEHESAWHCPAEIDAINFALAQESQFTPVAVAGLTLVRDLLAEDE